MWAGIKMQLFLAFREFDINYYEVYVLTLVLSCLAIWGLIVFFRWLFSPQKKDNIHVKLLKDDLVKSGPYKRDAKGIPTDESLVKLHAIIHRHSQKFIIEKE